VRRKRHGGTPAGWSQVLGAGIEWWRRAGRISRSLCVRCSRVHLPRGEEENEDSKNGAAFGGFIGGMAFVAQTGLCYMTSLAAPGAPSGRRRPGAFAGPCPGPVDGQER